MIDWPVIYSASEDTNHETNLATSSACASRPKAISVKTLACCWGTVSPLIFEVTSSILSRSGVLTTPGLYALTVILY